MTCTHCAWQVVCRASPIASIELDLGASVTVDASSSSCLDPNKVCISLRTYSAVAADLENSSRTIGGRPCLAAYYSPSHLQNCAGSATTSVQRVDRGLGRADRERDAGNLLGCTARFQSCGLSAADIVLPPLPNRQV